MKTRLFRLRASWMVGLALATARLQAGEPVRSGCETDYPPFCMVDPQGRADGFSVELLRAALRAMGREAAFTVGPWNEIKQSLADGRLEVLPLVGRTPEREDVFDFTVPYLTMHGAIVLREGTTDIEDIEDLRGREVAVMEGDNAEEFLRRIDRGIRIVTTPTFTEALIELSEGRHDAVVIQRLIGLRLLQESRIPGLRIVGKPIAGFRQDFCFAVREGEQDLLALLNEGLALVIADGTYRRLHAKWFAAMELPADRRIVIGGDHSYPPFEYLDAEGRPAGYTVEVTYALARRLGLSVEIRLGPWSEILEGLASGRIDAIQGLLYSPSRGTDVDFTQPHTVIHCVGVVRKGEAPPPGSVSELRGRRLVVQRGDILHDLAIEQGLGSMVSAVDSQEDALRELADGKHDCALVARLTALHWIEKRGWDNLVIGQRPLLSPGYCYAVPKNQQALLAELSEGLRLIKESGEYQDIYAKQLGVYEEQHGWLAFIRRAAWVVGPLLGLLALVSAWTWALRRQVSIRTAELREGELRFRTLADSGRALIWSSGPDKRCDYFNQTWLAFTGRTLDQELGDGWAEGLHPDDAAQCLAVRASSFDQRKRFSLIYRLRRRDGTYRWIQDDGVPRYDSRGGFIGYIGHGFDITDLKEAMTALQSREALLQIAGQATQLGGWAFTVGEDHVVWSDQVAAIHEMPAGCCPTIEEGIGFYAPEYRDRIRRAFETCLRDGTPYDEEVQIITSSGRPVWVRTIGMAARDESGRIVKVHGAFQDVSSQKQAAERIRDLLKQSDRARTALLSILEDVKHVEMALEEKGSFLDSLLNAIPTPVFYKDREGLYLGFNRAFADFFGQTREKLVGRSVFDIAPPRLAAVYHAKDVELLRNPGRQVYDSQIEDARASLRDVIFHKATFTDASGAVAGIVGVILDITDRREAEQQILKLNAELEQRVRERTAQLEAANKELEAFAYSVSHDLRAPLRSIDGFGHALIEELAEELSPTARDNLDRVRAAAQRMSRLIDALLGLSRLTRQEMRIQNVDLTHLAQEAVEGLRRTDRNRHVEVVIAPDLVVQGDAQLLRVAVENLMGNAWKFTRRQEKPRIEFGTGAGTSGPFFFVRDNGAGFDMAYADKLFGAFQRLHSDSDFEGTGIGLATVQRIIRRHGGRVWAEGEVDRGATFFFTLRPAAADSTETA